MSGLGCLVRGCGKNPLVVVEVENAEELVDFLRAQPDVWRCQHLSERLEIHLARGADG